MSLLSVIASSTVIRLSWEDDGDDRMTVVSDPYVRGGSSSRHTYKGFGWDVLSSVITVIRCFGELALMIFPRSANYGPDRAAVEIPAHSTFEALSKAYMESVDNTSHRRILDLLHNPTSKEGNMPEFDFPQHEIHNASYSRGYQDALRDLAIECVAEHGVAGGLHFAAVHAHSPAVRTIFDVAAVAAARSYEPPF